MSASDWILLVSLPVMLLAAGMVLYLSGRAAHREATRIVGGFGGPPGSHDVGLDLGRGADPDRSRQAVLSAQRRMLWGGILAGVGLIWLLVALLTRLF